MKKLLLILFSLLLANASTAQKIERVAPIYGNDEQANKMISYISENLRLVVPSGKSLEHINGVIRCKISVDPTGRISSINITSSVATWLDLVIVDGLKAIPPSKMWQSPTTRELNRALVFTFGSGKKGNKPTYGFPKEKIDQQTNDALDKWQKQAQDSLKKHWSKWEDKKKNDLKMPMPMTPEKRPQIPDLKTPPVTPPTNLPKVEISIE